MLRGDGGAVLLLSEEQRARLEDRDGARVPVSPAEERGVETCLTPGGKPGLSGTVPSALAASNRERSHRTAPAGSLVPVHCYRVSLGRTDAFICKFRKSAPAGLRPDAAPQGPRCVAASGRREDLAAATEPT